MPTDLPENEPKATPEASRLQRRTFYIAILALAIAIGHVVYAFIRDHVVD